MHRSGDILLKTFSQESESRTETVPMKVISDLLMASNCGLISVLELPDLSVASDTVDHLLQESEHITGIKINVLHWGK